MEFGPQFVLGQPGTDGVADGVHGPFGGPEALANAGQLLGTLDGPGPFDGSLGVHDPVAGVGQ